METGIERKLKAAKRSELFELCARFGVPKRGPNSQLVQILLPHLLQEANEDKDDDDSKYEKDDPSRLGPRKRPPTSDSSNASAIDNLDINSDLSESDRKQLQDWCKDNDLESDNDFKEWYDSLSTIGPESRFIAVKSTGVSPRGINALLSPFINLEKPFKKPKTLSNENPKNNW